MRLYLGIDGGGTGCRAAVAAADGVVLGLGAAASANVFTDPDGARANVVAAAEAALGAAGAPSRIGELVAALGLAGANVRDSAARFEGALPFARARVVSDALISVRGALGAGDGVTAAIGTGSVFAAQRGGAVRFVGGWGFVLGDQASGARLGRDLLEAALLAHDGMADPSPLLTEVVAEAGGPEGLVAFGQRARPAAFAAYAPRLLAAAAAGDAAAEAILARADADVAAAVDVLLKPGPAPLCFLGGLGPVFAARLAGRYGALIRQARGTALDGALALARELGVSALFTPEAVADPGRGPLYLQLGRRIAEGIASGALASGDALPPERELAALTGLSRVTVRKAVGALVAAGALVQRRGSGTFVAPRPERVEQSLSALTSFSEDMARRGRSARSVWLERGLAAASPEEMMALGLASGARVARLARLRLADGAPLAIERATLAAADLPDPQAVGASLYAALAARGLRPVRAVQRISAANVTGRDAGLLEVAPGAAALRIERVSYLDGGRVLEFTRSLYRGDAYDFVAELRLSQGPDRSSA